MNVGEVVSALGYEVICGSQGLDREVTGGYASDMLSCVMAGAAAGQVWVTLQAHPNVVAVADLLGLACVVITEGVRPDEVTMGKAEERGIPILSSEATTYTVVSELVARGVNGAPPKHQH